MVDIPTKLRVSYTRSQKLAAPAQATDIVELTRRERFGRGPRREIVSIADATWLGRRKHSDAIEDGEDPYGNDTLTIGP